MKMASSRKERIGSRRGGAQVEDMGGELEQDPEQGRESEDLFGSDDIHGGAVDDDDEPTEPPGINVDDWDDMNAHLGGEVGAAVVGAEEEEGQEEGEEDYEAMVARRVAEYVAQGRQHLLSSALTQRVSAWHNMIGPKLEAVELRKNFDIHEYGSQILGELPDREALGAPPGFGNHIHECQSF